IFFGLIGAAAFILIGMFVFMPMLKQQPVDVSMVSEIDARIKKLESRLSQLETSSSKQPVIALQEEKLNQMNERLEKLESMATQKLDTLTRDLDGLRKMSGPAKSASSEPPKTEPPAAKRTDTPNQPQKQTSAETQSTIRYHDVQPKETLFGIGKTYGLTVDEMRRLNQISSPDLIKVGQKLRVSP
ncbi:MAG: LysM peptidoglycan-binding domain-containing protein, partial [Desulfatirhabdiaceae bacterium]